MMRNHQNKTFSKSSQNIQTKFEAEQNGKWNSKLKFVKKLLVDFKNKKQMFELAAANLTSKFHFQFCFVIKKETVLFISFDNSTESINLKASNV